MTDFELQVAEALAEHRIYSPGLGRIRVGESVAQSLAPVVAEAIERAADSARRSPKSASRPFAAALTALRGSGETPQP